MWPPFLSIHSERNPLNAELADGIGKVGFRKWYERELLSSHAHMVLLIFATLGFLGSFEALNSAKGAEKVLDMAFIAMCALIAYWSMRRYLFLLMRAEEIANQATCAQCQKYGFVKVIDRATREQPMKVACKHCSHQWPISY